MSLLATAVAGTLAVTPTAVARAGAVVALAGASAVAALVALAGASAVAALVALAGAAAPASQATALVPWSFAVGALRDLPNSLALGPVAKALPEGSIAGLSVTWGGLSPELRTSFARWPALAAVDRPVGPARAVNRLGNEENGPRAEICGEGRNGS